MSKFRVGDEVVIIHGFNVGSEGFVIGDLDYRKCWFHADHTKVRERWCYVVDIGGTEWGYYGRHMRLKRPPEETATWNECVWQPRHISRELDKALDDFVKENA